MDRHRFFSYLLFFVLFSGLSTACDASPSAPPPLWQTENEEEFLFLRRIADFWQEGEYQIVKDQIEEFLELYPESSFSQTLYVTLGDLYVREKNYKSALLTYSKITDEILQERVLMNRMQCLLELQWFATLTEECETFLKEKPYDEETKLKVSYLAAVALYQQCLNASPDSEELSFLIEKGRPYFELLMDSELCEEVGPAFAHLCCLKKDFSSAANLYLQLSQRHGNNEEMLFQAALLQAKVDLPKAYALFEEVENLHQARAPDAVYNRMILMVETGRYEEIVLNKNALLAKLSHPRKKAALFLTGHAFLKLGRYSEAIEDLARYVEGRSDPSEPHKTALVDLLEAAYALEDDHLVKKIKDQLSELFPHEEDASKSVLAYALLIKKQQRIEEARPLFESLTTSLFEEERQRAIFELAHIEFLESNWTKCRTLCCRFLEQCNNKELAPPIGHFLATASFHLYPNQEEYITDLLLLLNQPDLFTTKDLNEWRYQLARTCIELKRFDEASEIIKRFLIGNPSDPHYADSLLLLAFYYRDGKNDHAEFYRLAKQALLLGTQLYEQGALHIALYNASLQRKDFATAADHLYLAAQTEQLEKEHLLWLSDFYYERVQSLASEELIHRCINTLEKFLNHNNIDIKTLSESSLVFEPTLIRLAELCGLAQQTEKRSSLLEHLKKARDLNPEWNWKLGEKVDLLLAEDYAHSGRIHDALSLLEEIKQKGLSTRDFINASATLLSARLQIEAWKKSKQGSVTKILSDLKNLVLQRTLANEPIHLEAAFEYIDLQVALDHHSPEKRLALSLKMREDFEQSADLLARDYQQSRKTNPKKDRLYSRYMECLNGEILVCRALLAIEQEERNMCKREARQIFLHILTEPETPFLEQRVKRKFRRTQKPSAAHEKIGNEE